MTRRCPSILLLSITILLQCLGVLRAQLASQVAKFGLRANTPSPKNAALKKLCDACYPTPGPFCTEVNKQCEKSLCAMCLYKTWTCEISITGGPPGLNQQVADPRTQLALCSQFKAYGCAKHIQVCPFPDKKQDWLFRWVDERTYGGYFPQPILPAEACLHDPEDKKTAKDLCQKCKGAVQLTALECPYTNPPSNDEDQSPMTPQAFINSDVEPKEQIPKHKSYANRCEEVKKVFNSKKGSMQSEFKSKICSCLGCCDEDPACYFSSTFNVESVDDKYS